MICTHLKAIYTVVSVASEGKNRPKKGVEGQRNMTIRHRETAPRKKKEIATYNENMAKKGHANSCAARSPQTRTEQDLLGLYCNNSAPLPAGFRKVATLGRNIMSPEGRRLLTYQYHMSKPLLKKLHCRPEALTFPVFQVAQVAHELD